MAIERQIKDYCDAHPGGPAAVRRPRVSQQGGAWIVLLGANVEMGIAGVGPTLEAALAAFDWQYRNRLRPMVASGHIRRNLSPLSGNRAGFERVRALVPLDEFPFHRRLRSLKKLVSEARALS